MGYRPLWVGSRIVYHGIMSQDIEKPKRLTDEQAEEFGMLEIRDILDSIDAGKAVTLGEIVHAGNEYLRFREDDK